MTALRRFSSPASTAIYDAIGTARATDDLDECARRLWAAYGDGAVGDADAETLQSFIDRRRQRGPAAKAAAKAAQSSRFISRQRPRSPNLKASRERRRRLGGSSALPDTLRHHYTEGQRAVLCVVAGEVKHHGTCYLPIDKIGALAGVCRTTVQTTMHEARLLGHIKITERPRPGLKHLSNVVEIISPEWNVWIKRGPSAHKPNRVQNTNLVSTTKTILKDDERAIDEATQLSAEIAEIAGYDDRTLPPWWSNPHAVLTVHGWVKDLNAVGIGSQWLPSVCKWVMGRKPERTPPRSIGYFEPEVKRLIERQRVAAKRSVSA